MKIRTRLAIIVLIFSTIFISLNQLIFTEIQEIENNLDKTKENNQIISSKLKDLQNSIILINIFSTMIAIIIAYSFYLTIISPISVLTQSVNEITKGNLDAPINATKGDLEIKQLAESIDNMRNSLKLVIEEYENSSKK